MGLVLIGVGIGFLLALPLQWVYWRRALGILRRDYAIAVARIEASR